MAWNHSASFRLTRWLYNHAQIFNRMTKFYRLNFSFIVFQFHIMDHAKSISQASPHLVPRFMKCHLCAIFLVLSSIFNCPNLPFFKIVNVKFKKITFTKYLIHHVRFHYCSAVGTRLHHHLLPRQRSEVDQQKMVNKTRYKEVQYKFESHTCSLYGRSTRFSKRGYRVLDCSLVLSMAVM